MSVRGRDRALVVDVQRGRTGWRIPELGEERAKPRDLRCACARGHVLGFHAGFGDGALLARRPGDGRVAKEKDLARDRLAVVHVVPPVCVRVANGLQRARVGRVLVVGEPEGARSLEVTEDALGGGDDEGRVGERERLKFGGVLEGDL